MKKSIIKIWLIIFIFAGFLLANDMNGTKSNITQKTNPDLPVLKDNWQGNVMINGKFFNDTVAEKAPLWNVLKWKLSRNPQRKEKKRDTFQLQMLPIEKFEKNENYIIWLGHSSFIISVNGALLLIDPVFFNLPNAKRKVALPCDIDDLRNIDYLLISHDHRDCEDLFKEIRQLFGDIDICLLPIGAYSPAFLMQREHTNPEEAVQAFSDLGGKLFIPMHYGTYDLSNEPS